MPKTENVILRSIAYRNLAAALESLGRSNEALEVYENAEILFVDSRHPKWLPMGKARIYSMLGAFNKAIGIYEGLLNGNISSDATVYDALSRCYEGLGKFDAALEHAWNAMTLTISNKAAIDRVSRLSELTGNLKYLEESLYRSIRIDRRMNIDVVELINSYLVNVYAMLEEGELTDVVTKRFASLLQDARKMRNLPPAALSNTYKAELFFYISNGKLNQAIAVKNVGMSKLKGIRQNRQHNLKGRHCKKGLMT